MSTVPVGLEGWSQVWERLAVYFAKEGLCIK